MLTLILDWRLLLEQELGQDWEKEVQVESEEVVGSGCCVHCNKPLCGAGETLLHRNDEIHKIKHEEL